MVYFSFDVLLALLYLVAYSIYRYLPVQAELVVRSLLESNQVHTTGKHTSLLRHLIPLVIVKDQYFHLVYPNTCTE